MKGTLYRYPHPFDSSRFLYVGQGPKRDKQHRSEKSSFGRRFKKLFPNIELPQPIRKEVEVQNQLELNELETIWMFQYHTWHTYPGGMNISFPGTSDYHVTGRMGGRVGGPRAAIVNMKNKTSIFAPGIAAKGGRIGGYLGAINQPREIRVANGRKAIKSGQLAEAVLASIKWAKEHPEKSFYRASKGGRINGPIQGRKNVESGHLARLRTPEHQRAAGLVNAKNKTGVCGRSSQKMSEDGRKGGLVSSHKRYHVARGILNLKCEFCKEIQSGNR